MGSGRPRTVPAGHELFHDLGVQLRGNRHIYPTELLPAEPGDSQKVDFRT